MTTFIGSPVQSSNYHSSTLKINRPLNPEEVVGVIAQLFEDRTLSVVNLRCTELSNDGLEWIAMALQINQTVHTLEVGELIVDSKSRRNLIDARGAEHLGRLLYLNPALTSLSLCVTDIGNAGAQHLTKGLIAKNSGLISLSVEHSKITFAGAKELVKAAAVHTSLTALSLWGNPIGPKGAVFPGMVSINPTLTKLELGETGMGGEGVGILLAAGVQVHKTLTHLDLSENGLTAKEISPLAEAVSTHGALTNLQLGSNRISCAGARSLAAMLGVNTTLNVLSLLKNQIGDRGTEQLAASLERNASLRGLKLTGNDIGVIGLHRLQTAIRVNNSIVYLTFDSPPSYTLSTEIVTEAEGVLRERVPGTVAIAEAIEILLQANRDWRRITNPSVRKGSVKK